MKSEYCMYEVKIGEGIYSTKYWLSTFSPMHAVKHALNTPHLHEKGLITIKKMD